MTNEAIQVEGPYTSHDWTVNSVSGIPQFSLCVGEDPRTAKAGVAGDSAPVFAGIALTEKDSTSDATNLGLTKEGIFDLVDAGGGGSAGAQVVISGINTVRDAVAGDLLTGAIVGTRLEDASASEVKEVQLVGNS